jgi:alginate export protein
MMYKRKFSFGTPGKKIMKLAWGTRTLALSVCSVLSLVAPFVLAAQEPAESAPHTLWSRLKEGKISFETRYRFEAFERDGAPFTAPAYAPTLRIALGYETPPFHGFSAFAQGLAVIVTGPADYSIPTLPSQNRPDRPAILDPKYLELGQGYVKWTRGPQNKKLAVTLGRQEIMLNDGRFVSILPQRQNHQTFDAGKLSAELPQHFSFTYAFLNRANRTVGHDATDGKPPMHSQLLNLAWAKPGQINVSLYGVLLDYRAPPDYTQSTQTLGLRATGPYQFSQHWSALYAAEFANQKNFGSNPNRVNENYYLGELGPGWRGLGIQAGYALLQGRSATDKLNTPLSHPFNGWTDLFANNPSLGGSHGLEARYLTAKGAPSLLGGGDFTVTYFDYHSDSNRIHYGSELDMALAYKVRRVSKRWEIGWRFGRYWADHLFMNAVRTSIYTSFTL